MSGPSGFEEQMEEKGFKIVEEGDVQLRTGRNEALEGLTETEKINVDFSEANQINLPPDARPLREWCEQDQRYSSYSHDFPARISFKLLKTWILWATMITNTKIIELLHTKTEDEDSDEYHAKAIIFETIDHLGKLLSDTDTKQELKYLAKLSSE